MLFSGGATMLKYAIIGFGCAGYHAAKALRQADQDATIDVYSDHNMAPYNPMLTTYYASDRLPYEGMFPFGSLDSIKKSLRLSVYTNTPVRRLEGRSIITDHGSQSYDKVLIATGATAFVPPISGLNDVSPDRVFCMRTVNDAERLRVAVKNGGHKTAVVIGASMVGIKVVELLARAGIHTTLVDMAPYLFPLAAYPDVGEAIQRRVATHGIEMLFGAGLQSLAPRQDGTISVCLSTGATLSADLLVLCIGTRAAISFLNRDEIKINRGIVVNQHMETSLPGIYAAGDCCEGNNLQSGDTQIIGLWANAAQQGHTAGINMAGGHQFFYGNILHNITHFLDMDFIGLGDNRITGHEITFGSLEKGLFIKAIINDGTLAGVNILNNYRISGILKNYFIRLLEGHTQSIASLQQGILQKEGLTQRFISELEGALK